MSDNTPKQLSLFDQSNDKPIPLQLAAEYDFELTIVDQDGDAGNYLYLARDWYIGMGGTDSGWRHMKNDWVNAIHAVEMEVKRPRRKPEMMDFVGEEGLYYIAANMQTRKDRPQLDKLNRYLAWSGKKLADYIRNPEQGIKELKSLAARKRQKELGKYQRAGLSDRPEIKHLELRNDSIAIYNALMETVQSVCDNPQYGQITNSEYIAMFNQTTAQLRALLNTKKIRNELPSTQLMYLSIAERQLQDYLKMHHDITNEEVLEGITLIVAPLGVHLRNVCEILGVHHVTNTALLAGGEA